MVFIITLWKYAGSRGEYTINFMQKYYYMAFGGKIHICTLGAWALKMCIFLERVDIYLLHIKGSGCFSHENLKIKALEGVHPPQNIAFPYKFVHFHSLIGSPAEVI